MSTVSERLAVAGFTLGAPSAAFGAYVPAVRAGGLVFTSGQLPIREGELLASGIVGDGVLLEQAVACAQVCALNCLTAASTVCNLDDVIAVLRLTGYVACGPDFTQQPEVINGASEVMRAAFGEAGTHAREAIGVAALPLGAPVEVSAVLCVAK